MFTTIGVNRAGVPAQSFGAKLFLGEQFKHVFSNYETVVLLCMIVSETRSVANPVSPVNS